MVVLKGKGVYGGVVKGTLHFYKKSESRIKRYHVEDPEREIFRLITANERAVKELQML